jgi:hypothetical protein
MTFQVCVQLGSGKRAHWATVFVTNNLDAACSAWDGWAVAGYPVRVDPAGDGRREERTGRPIGNHGFRPVTVSEVNQFRDHATPVTQDMGPPALTPHTDPDSALNLNGIGPKTSMRWVDDGGRAD